MKHEDLDSIMELEHKSFSVPWTRGMFEDELYNPSAYYLVLEISGKVCGYAGFWKILDEGHITNVAVHPDFRRSGYGRLLISSLIANAKEYGITALTLEVRVGNIPAISLYESFGFRTSGRRRHYYPDNKEDAFIMWLHFDS
jgi:ribosomal-protein-alanine N-acetyltransferase